MRGRGQPGPTAEWRRWSGAIKRAAALAAVTGLLGIDAGSAAVAPCVDDCAELAVDSPVADEDGIYHASITFQQGPDDEAPGGIDAIVAIAFSLAIPGLELADCGGIDEQGIAAAVRVPAEVAATFWVIVENTRCAGGAPCLCPGPGQARAGHVNVAIFGPRTLPLAAFGAGGGPMAALARLARTAQVDFPLLPNGELLGLALKPIEPPLRADARLHFFAETDSQETTPKPPTAAFVSIGDDEAADQTVDRQTGVSRLRTVDGLIAAAAAAMAGDCDGDQDVGIGELQLCVNVFLDEADIEECLACDTDGDGEIGIVDLQGAIGCFLGGPGDPGCPTL